MISHNDIANLRARCDIRVDLLVAVHDTKPDYREKNPARIRAAYDLFEVAHSALIRSAKTDLALVIDNYYAIVAAVPEVISEIRIDDRFEELTGDSLVTAKEQRILATIGLLKAAGVRNPEREFRWPFPLPLPVLVTVTDERVVRRVGLNRSWSAPGSWTVDGDDQAQESAVRRQSCQIDWADE